MPFKSAFCNLKSEMNMTYRGRANPAIIILALSLASLACNLTGQRPAGTLPPVRIVTSVSTNAPTDIPTPAATSTPWWIPTFEPAACQFFVPPGYEPTCGYLSVPEDRGRPDAARFIRLHVAVFHCLGGPACRPDAVIHLTGGPGSYGLAIVSYMFDNGAAAILQERDYVFFDQRGIGTSQPALDCLEDEDAETCRNRLTADGTDLNAYNSAASAADIQDLRSVLGYSEVNLLGVSYGTRLALTTMRDQPQGIRSAILDSTYPPQVNLYVTWSANAERALNEVFAACAADPACNTAYPDLETVFYQVIDQLNDNPISVDVQGSGRFETMEVNGDLFMDAIFNSLYRTSGIPRVPKIIYQTRDGDYRLLATRLAIYLDRSSSLGMNYSVQCYEEIPFSTWDDVLNATANLEHPQSAFFSTRWEYFFELCKTWVTASPPAIENEPVSSPIPTLILAGQFDPITPPEWGDLAAQTLPNSTVFHFPTGHWILRSGPCGWEVVQEFLDNPTVKPEAPCTLTLAPLTFEP
jgi:pimeloyl-ACP methyl ester carboxylesterase